MSSLEVDYAELKMMIAVLRDSECSGFQDRDFGSVIVGSGGVIGRFALVLPRVFGHGWSGKR